MIHTANHLVELAEAELGHVFTYLFGEEEEEIDDVLGLPVNFGAI